MGLPSRKASLREDSSKWVFSDVTHDINESIDVKGFTSKEIHIELACLSQAFLGGSPIDIKGFTYEERGRKEKGAGKVALHLRGADCATSPGVGVQAVIGARVPPCLLGEEHGSAHCQRPLSCRGPFPASLVQLAKLPLARSLHKEWRGPYQRGPLGGLDPRPCLHSDTSSDHPREPPLTA